MSGPDPVTRSSSIWGRLYHGETRFDFVGRWKIWFALSLVVILIGGAGFATRGLNLGIDFTGGTVWELPAGSATVAEVTDAMSDLGYRDVQVQETTQTGGDRLLRVKAESRVEPSDATTEALERAEDALDGVGELGDEHDADLRAIRDDLIAVNGPFDEDVPQALEDINTQAELLAGRSGDEDGDPAPVLDTLSDLVADLEQMEIEVQAAAYGDVTERLVELTSSQVDEVTIDTVGPSWGQQISEKARNALVVFLLAIAIFITVRFEVRMAVATIAALMHDLVVVVGLYALFGFAVTPATVVAMLTMLGFSIYDGIVVFDRVDENTALLKSRSKLTYSRMANLSLNQVLMRSLNTSITTLLPIASVLVIGSLLLGATTLEEFGLALLLGLLVGAYSSIFIATPLLALLKEREPRYRELREQVAAKGHGEVTGDDDADVDDDPVLTSVVRGGQAPRPRKKGRKR